MSAAYTTSPLTHDRDPQMTSDLNRLSRTHIALPYQLLMDDRLRAETRGNFAVFVCLASDEALEALADLLSKPQDLDRRTQFLANEDLLLAARVAGADLDRALEGDERMAACEAFAACYPGVAQ